MGKKVRERIIPVFLPGEGCPGKCVFCSLPATIGDVENVDRQIEKVLSEAGNGCVIAFYGGSFSHLPQSRQQSLLGGIQPAIDDGRVSSIRVSARPDGLDRYSWWASLNVGSVEFGVQSFADSVLEAIRRGHDASCVAKAVDAARGAGLEVGIQIMIGLPAEGSRERELTLNRLMEIKPDFVRISPTLVLRNTALEKSYLDGEYKPLEMEETISILGEFCRSLGSAGIRIARIGLHRTPELMRDMVAGPWHPRLGELARERAAGIRETRFA